MKLKKINAVLALLSILLLLAHVGFSVFAYLTMYYNPILTLVFAWPFMITACLHAVCGMLTVFFMQTEPGWICILKRTCARFCKGCPLR